jgi:hypothetical protein
MTTPYIFRKSHDALGTVGGSVIVQDPVSCTDPGTKQPNTFSAQLNLNCGKYWLQAFGEVVGGFVTVIGIWVVAQEQTAPGVISNKLLLQREFTLSRPSPFTNPNDTIDLAVQPLEPDGKLQAAITVNSGGSTTIPFYDPATGFFYRDCIYVASLQVDNLGSGISSGGAGYATFNPPSAFECEVGVADDVNDLETSSQLPAWPYPINSTLSDESQGNLIDKLEEVIGNNVKFSLHA